VCVYAHGGGRAARAGARTPSGARALLPVGALGQAPELEQRVIAVADADAALVVRCRSNDAAAFDEIVARYKDKVYNYICRMIGPGVDAEDLAQETFVRAYSSINSFQGRATLNTWLLRIATNLCIDYSRRRRTARGRGMACQNEVAGEGGEAARDIPDTRYEPQAAVLNEELGEQLSRAVRQLPEKARMVVLLHDVEGLPYEDISRIVQCPLGTVKSRLFNARMALREKLAPYLEGSLPGPEAAAAPAARRGGRR
jgi:RNA polymerase sigma-70 factor, ECF subfamily